MRTLLVLTMAAVAGTVIFGCGVNNEEDVEAMIDNFGPEVDVELEIAGGEFYYEPDELTVEAGSEVRVIFVNEGETAHDLIIDDVGETEIIGSGESESFVFSAPQDEDVLVFYCSVGRHREQGMEGEIEIIEP